MPFGLFETVCQKIIWPSLNVEENNEFESCRFNKFLKKIGIWPFFIFEDLAFLKLLMDKFGLFKFF